MASQIVSVSSIVPFPLIATETKSSQNELAELFVLRARMRDLEQQIESTEADIRTRLQSGSEVEGGERSVELKESSRRSVAWREVAERLAIRAFGKRKGEFYCPRVLAATHPSISYSLKIS